MVTTEGVVVPLPQEPEANPPLISNGVFGMLVFVFTEIMFFAGLISAFIIVRSGASVWPPPGQPRLPFEDTALNTAALLVSGAVLLFAERAWRDSPAKASGRFLLSILLGAFFVVFQGVEWAGLLQEGLTMTSSTHGAFFYVIVGTHALHAVVALLAMAWGWLRLRSGTLSQSAFRTIQVFWYFVVLLWPFIYLRVYL